MKRFAGISTILALCLVFSSFSINPEGGEGIKPSKYKTFLGCSKDGRGYMSPEKFLALIDYPVCAFDSAGKRFKVKSFEVSYAETGLYQDEEGLPKIVTDYTQGTFRSDTFTTAWRNLFKAHAYQGDTVRLENVIVYGDKDRPMYGQNIILVLR